MANDSESTEPEAKTLFNDPTMSDVKLIQIKDGESREYFAHRAILSNQSDYFKNAFNGNFKEAKSPEFELYDDDPNLFEIVLKFIYTSVYDKSLIQHLTENDYMKKLLMTIQIEAVADKYDVRRLHMPLAEDVAVMMRSSPRGGFTPKQIVAAVQTHYDSCPRTESTIGKVFANALHDSHWTLKHDPIVKELFTRYPNFAIDLLLAIIG